MEKLNSKFKEELLQGLSELKLSYSDFNHSLEDSSTTYDTATKYFETEHLNVTIEIEEEAYWSDYDFYETNNLEITFLKVVCENGEVDISELNDDELLNQINY